MAFITGCGGSVPSSTDGPPSPAVAPLVRVVSIGADSSLIAVVNPSSTAQTWGFNPCPIRAQARVDTGWVHAGYLIEENSACPLFLQFDLPGSEAEFWVPTPLPFEGRVLRLGIGAFDPSAVPGGTPTWIYSEPIMPPASIK